MKTVRQLAKSTALIILGMVTGALGAIAIMSKGTQPAHAMNSYVISESIETQAYLRYRFAEPDVARRSLLLCIDVLERNRDDLRELQPHWFAQRLGLAYARLALLSERLGDQGSRDRSFRSARIQFATADIAITEDELRKAVRDADERWDQAVRSTVPTEGSSVARKVP